jgi:SAM-dependent methyltransferase
VVGAYRGYPRAVSRGAPGFSGHWSPALVAWRPVSRLNSWQRLRSLIGHGATVAPADQTPMQPEPTDDDRRAAEPQRDSPPPPGIDATHLARGELVVGQLSSETGPATRLLHERLSADDIAAVEQLIRDTPGAWEHYADAPDEGAKRQVLLAFGAWLGATRVCEKTGLVALQPPEDIHVMARGPLAAVGGLYEADLIVDSLTSAAADIAGLRSGLDFGCSSGRVVRVLAAAYPDVHWHGCDPNAPAVAWASENLPGIAFFVNGDVPPLPLADGSLDLVYAISIWSHFAPDLGLRWFEEMHRLLRPGGHLVCTTHGLTSIAYYATRELRPVEQSQEIRDALYRDGSWYAPEFGEEGDWGVVNPDWGTAFLSPEWMLTKLCPAWRVLEFAPGRNQENQDVYVLQRV